MVIIHYNDYDSLYHLINNVKNYSVISKIVVVDNNSSKKIKEGVKQLSSRKIKIIENKENLGFSKAINIGSKILIKELNKRTIGVVAPTIIEGCHLNRGWKNPSPFLDSMLNLVYIHRFFRKKYVFYNEKHYESKTSLVEVVSGCFFVLKSRTLEKINFLDENTFLYYEENILAKKMKELKLYLLVCNDVFIIHNHSVSIDKNLKRIKKLKLQKQSQYYFQTTYNHANMIEKFLLKGTAFISRIVLTTVYFIKDLGK